MKPGFAHPVLMIVRNCLLIRGSYNICRILVIMSNRTSLTCGILSREQCGLAGFPGDHEQSRYGGRGVGRRDSL